MSDMLEQAEKERLAAEERAAEIERSRIKIVSISEQDMLQIFERREDAEFLYVVRFPELPAGYEVRGAMHDFMTRSLLVKVWHPTFEPVTPGHQMPFIVSDWKMERTRYARQPLGE